MPYLTLLKEKVTTGNQNAEAPEIASETAVGVEDKKTLMLVYAMMGGGIIFFPLFIAGFVISLVKRSSSTSAIAADHHRWLIRTFIVGMIVGAIGFALSLVVVGCFVLLANVIYLIYRIVKGWICLSDGRSVYA